MTYSFIDVIVLELVMFEFGSIVVAIGIFVKSGWWRIAVLISGQDWRWEEMPAGDSEIRAGSSISNKIYSLHMEAAPFLFARSLLRVVGGKEERYRGHYF